MQISTRRALDDLAGGLKQWRLWGLLGWRDVVQRYRRTTLGPLWLTINIGVFICMIGFLYSRLLHQPLYEYLSFLTLGYIAWSLLSTYIVDSCDAFTKTDKMIKQRRVPLSLFVYRILWHNFIVFFHNMVLFVVVALIVHLRPSWSMLLVIPGLVLFAVNAAWAGLLMGTLTARFRDVQQFLSSGINIIFFVTPIFWNPNMLGNREALINFNPFYHFIQILRAPLLGTAPSAINWIVTGALAVIGWAFTFALFRRARPRIPYWL
jgi:ABC-type polysaccharide/polyol phosphate export permease